MLADAKCELTKAAVLDRRIYDFDHCFSSFMLFFIFHFLNCRVYFTVFVSIFFPGKI